MRGLNSETHGLSVYVDEKPAPILTYIFPPIKLHCNVCGRSDKILGKKENYSPQSVHQ